MTLFWLGRRRISITKLYKNISYKNYNRSTHLVSGKLSLCNPGKCKIDCKYKTFGKDNTYHEYDEILKKYPLISHIEKTEYPLKNFYSIEVFSKVFCPPGTLYDHEDEVLNQIDRFFQEIGVECDDEGFGIGFFSASGSIIHDRDPVCWSAKC
jgi:hypothetical protein